MASATTYAAVPETAEPQIQQIINIPQEIEPPLSDQCCIYTVPVHLRKLSEEAYTPRLISIGPIHSNNPELKKMEKQKQRYLLAFWGRVLNKQALVNYKAFLEENKENIRNSYSEADLCKEDQFVDMILLDSVFILELFLRKSNESEQKNDYMFTTSWVCKSTQRDLSLLENQVPYFVLEELYKRDFKGKDSSVSFVELALKYFEDYFPFKVTVSRKSEVIGNCESCKHFTDLIRYFYLPKEFFAKGWNPSKHFAFQEEYVPKTATKLHEAGVSFEKVQNKILLDIKFKKIPILNWFLCLGCIPCLKCFKARLQIPQLKVDQCSECLLRNLIALEQCHYSDQPFICNYVSLIDSLIHTQEDVEFLVDKEAIVHDLGSHTELATLVNGLCKHVVVTPTCYGKIIVELNNHYYNNWKFNMGMLRSVYFRDPWRLSSTIVGVAIFVFAIVNFLRVIGVIHSKL